MVGNLTSELFVNNLREYELNKKFTAATATDIINANLNVFKTLS